MAQLTEGPIQNTSQILSPLDCMVLWVSLRPGSWLPSEVSMLCSDSDCIHGENDVGYKQSLGNLTLKSKTLMDSQDKLSSILDPTSPSMSSLSPPHLATSRHVHHSSDINQTRIDCSWNESSWSPAEHELFCIFWFLKIKELPIATYSIRNPLGRAGYNRQLSDFLLKHQSDPMVPATKSPSQCKTRFATIKRKLNNQIIKEAPSTSASPFIDYITKQIQEMAKREKEYPGLKRQLEELKEMQRQQSPLMHVTGCLQRLELKEKEELYESMFRYLQKSEGSEGSEKRKKTEKLEKLKELEQSEGIEGSAGVEMK